MARPRKKIDPSQVEKLAAINCSYAEAAAVLGCSPDTIQRRYAAVFKKGREHGRMSLKRKMWDTAMGGHVTMMIWLSKQMLGYTDKVEQKQKTELTETKVIEVQWSDEITTQNEKPDPATKENQSVN